MFSDERKGVMQLLHQIVAAVEQKAIEMGFEKAKAFAGGSCKELFCDDQEKCCVVAENKPCRHIAFARPSMSGFGIDIVDNEEQPLTIANSLQTEDRLFAVTRRSFLS